MDATIISALVVVVIILIAVAALWKKRRRVLKDKIPSFKCKIASKGKESGKPNSPDVYDCVEVKDDHKADKET